MKMRISHLAQMRPMLSRKASRIPGGSFAFVMATGIVSIAAELLDFNRLAMAYFAINLAGFPVLTVLMLHRLIRNPGALASELSHYRTGPGFLTFVAAAAVLGNEVAVLTEDHRVAAFLWLIACGTWVALVFAMFALLTTQPVKPPHSGGIDGSWLLIVVATEALAVLGTYVRDSFARPDIVVWLSLCWFLLGGLFYSIIIQMIMHRWLFGSLRPTELTPPYWINMGAMAIAVLAGSRLESLAGTEALPAALLPAVSAATMLFWAVAAWWIPLLAVLTIWRHTAGGVRLSYDFEHWSAVFPLGMFTAATWSWSHVNHFEFLYWIPYVFFGIAVLGWLACFTGMIRRVFMTAVLYIEPR
jgi:tellurite resistance protein TehA-like permease